MTIQTFHATLSDPADFERGILPLTHFGDPRIGLWAVARELSKRAAHINSVDELPAGAWLLPIALEADRPLEFHDWHTPYPKGLLYDLFEKGFLDERQHRDHRENLDTVAGEHPGGKTPAGLKYVGDVIRGLGYDSIRYDTCHEDRGIAEFSAVTVGPSVQTPTCWCNLEVEQATIAGPIHLVPRMALLGALRVHLQEFRGGRLWVRAFLNEVGNVPE